MVRHIFDKNCNLIEYILKVMNCVVQPSCFGINSIYKKKKNKHPMVIFPVIYSAKDSFKLFLKEEDSVI